MALIKKRNLHEMGIPDLLKKLGEVRLELSKERGQIKIGGAPSNPGRVREVRKTIAKLLTELKIKHSNKKTDGGRKG